MKSQRKKVLYTKRFFPAGIYTWVVPAGCTSVDVFLVGGGGGAADAMPGAGGYTKTFKRDTTGWRDGDAVPVTAGQFITIIVGAGGIGSTVVSNARNGGYTQFLNSSYIAGGGGCGYKIGSESYAGDGGSGGAGLYGAAGSDGSDGTGTNQARYGLGQGHTTRDFGEPTGKINAGGGGANRGTINGGASDYAEGSGGQSSSSQEGYARGGGGYGGGGAGATYPIYVGNGGDGTVLIRYLAY